MIRSVRPTDLAALLAFVRKGPRNEAKTGRNLGPRERPFSPRRFLEEWLSLDENRYTWIDISAGRVEGLISVRSRPSPISWQVDRLVLAPEAWDKDVCLDLLEYTSVVGGEVGIQKVFLRVERSSGVMDVARQAGFLPYKSELLYRRESLEDLAGDEGLLDGEVRAKRPGDEYALFQLYSSAVPCHVRQAEAMTFEEWKAMKKRDLSLATRQDLVLERGAALVGWLRVRRGGQVNSFDILAGPQEAEAPKVLLTHCLGLLDRRRPTVCLLSEYRDGLRHLLEEYGFGLAGEYASMVKQLAVRVRQPHFMPARV